MAKSRLGLPDTIRACFFDLDGVLTETATLHAKAWKEMFDAFLSARARSTGQPFVPFDVVRDYDTSVDGLVAAEQHLRGKPAPDTFLAAARALGVAPAQATVFEDALVGVEAGRAGRFGFAVDVDRVGQADELCRHGADTVVRDLAEMLEAP